ncbi:uncharacterized protein [Lolium perenne]|uniref:uncharacterized protein n=1 Tax=Lolium perenne TaxID=4522 RepID=UPI0021F5D050|nr:uncharacterized protein LOC127327787 isoform X2 [Lolium perenne]
MKMSRRCQLKIVKIGRKEEVSITHAGRGGVAVHKQAMKIENGGEDVDDLEVFARTHRHEKGKGKYANKKAEKLVDEFNNCVKESGNTQVDKQKVWVQLTRGHKRGRYYGLLGIIDKDHAHRSSTPVLINGTQPMYTQQQVQDIVSQAVTSAVREVREELGTRIQSLERIFDKPNTESHSHVLEEPQSSAVPEFLQALTMGVLENSSILCGNRDHSSPRTTLAIMSLQNLSPTRSL